MRKVLLLLAGTAVLWLPAVSVAGDSSRGLSSKPAARTETLQASSHASNSASTCKSQQGPNFAASHNGQTFKQFYGTNRGKRRGAGANAFGECVSTIAVHKAESGGKDSAESDGKDSAENEAKNSGENDGKDSAESHGKDSAERKDSAESLGNDRVNPAMACKAMRASDPGHFRDVYGTRPNAFGKCVAKQASSKKR